MIDTSIGKAAGYPTAASVEAFAWLAARDGGLLDELVRRLLSQRPEIPADVVESAGKRFADRMSERMTCEHVRTCQRPDIAMAIEARPHGMS
jgi:hypothetical protein